MEENEETTDHCVSSLLVAAVVQADITLLLSEEILLAVFQLLAPERLLRAGQVCRRWRRVSRDERLWKHHQLQLWSSTPDSDSEEVVFTGFSRIACVLLAAPRIEALAMHRLAPSLAKRMLKVVEASSCKIQKLSIHFSGDDCEPLFCELLRKQAQTLITLNIARVDVNTIVMMEPMGQLQHLSIMLPSGVPFYTPSKEWKLTHLRTLRIAGPDRDDSRLLKMLLKHNSATLEEAAVRIEYRSTLAVLLCCENLQKLEIIDAFVGKYRLDKDFLIYLEDLPRLTDLILSIGPVGFHKNRLYGGVNVCHLEFLPEQISSLTLTFQMASTNIQPLLKRFRDLKNLQHVWIHGLKRNIDQQKMLKGFGPHDASYVFTE